MGHFSRVLVVLLFSLIPVPGLAQAVGPPAVIIPDGSLTVGVLEGRYYPVSVRVYDAQDNPVLSPNVVWSVRATGPRAAIVPLGGDDGQSQVAVKGIGGLGTYQLTATIDGLAPVVFTVTNYAVPLRVLSGGHQSTMPLNPFTVPLVVEARTIYGDPISGAEVYFTVPASGARAIVNPPIAVTDANGHVSVSLFANNTAGRFDVIVTAPSVDYATEDLASFSVTSSAPQAISVQVGPGLELPVGGGTREITARVTDANGQPVRGVAVTFEAPTSGAGFEEVDTFFMGSDPALVIPGGARVFTNYEGVATLQVSANDELGSYTVTATADGIASPRTFTMSNVPPAIAAIQPNGQAENLYAGEEAPVNGRFESIRFRVVDADGGGLPGVTLTLAAPTSGASLTLDATTIVTGADGYAEATGTANGTAGTYYVKATTAALPDPVNMLMQNVPPGYRPGDQIVDLSAFDDTGTLRSLRGFVGTGRYLLLDVCTVWCTFCRFTQPMGLEMQAELAARGIPIAVVPMLVDSATVNQPSTQANAAAWKLRYGTTDPVLHASADPSSPVRTAGAFILGADRPGYPTFLLVGPDGTILERHRGGWNSADEMVNLVLAHVPSSISIASVTVDEGAGSATLTVSRSPATGSSSVSYATVVGSANATDFTSRSGQLQFAPGSATATITVPIANDVMDEPAEQFSVRLTNPIGARITTGVATVTIVDNDAPPAVSVADTRLTEGTGTINTALIAVRLDRASAFPITAAYRLVAGTAKSTDFTLAKGEVSFSAGNTVAYASVDLIADKISEAKETFTIELVSATNATLGAAVATVSIVDDDGDTLPPVIEAKSDVVIEVKMAATGSVIVDYKIPAAKDANDGVVPVNCVAPSGGKFGMGTTSINCTAEDRAGHLAVRAFNVIVRLPTVAGAIFNPHDRTTPLTTAERGDTVLVHVNAGAFASRAKVTLTFIDEKGRRHELCHGKAGVDGSLDEKVELPHGAARGLGQVLAESADAAAEYDRAWFLTLTRKNQTRR